MKTLRNLTFICATTIIFLLLSSKTGKSEILVVGSTLDTSSNYADGIYVGSSQSIYTGEPFWGHIEITVAGGAFTDVKFKIRDSTTHENVDSMYGVIHYQSIPMYMEQCVNEEHGIETYPQLLLQQQDIDNVDGITHATWSYNIFVASANKALPEDENPDDIPSTSGISKVLVEALPNPFNSILNFRYSLPQKSFVNLTVYDEQGKLLNVLVNKEQTAGNYVVEWADCPKQGIYFYRLQTDNAVFSSKVVGATK